jgi:hypothetical protein
MRTFASFYKRKNIICISLYKFNKYSVFKKVSTRNINEIIIIVIKFFYRFKSNNFTFIIEKKICLVNSASNTTSFLLLILFKYFNNSLSEWITNFPVQKKLKSLLTLSCCLDHKHALTFARRMCLDSSKSRQLTLVF